MIRSYSTSRRNWPSISWVKATSMRWAAGLGRHGVGANGGTGQPEQIDPGRQIEDEIHDPARLDVELDGGRAPHGHLAERHQGVDLGVESALLALGLRGGDDDGRGRLDVLVGVGHGQLDLFADEGRQLVLADPGGAAFVLGFEGQILGGQQRHHAALALDPRARTAAAPGPARPGPATGRS